MGKLTYYPAYKRLVRGIAKDGPRATKMTLDFYDQCLTDFLAKAKKEQGTGATDKLMWHLMRAGIRTEINAYHSRQRAELKDTRDRANQITATRARHEREERHRRAYAEEQAERDRRLGPILTMDQIIERGQREVAKMVETEASKRAAEILTTWLCDGVELGKITGSKLDQLWQREEAMADGHLSNAGFYRALREHTPDDVTVGSIAPETVLSAFSNAFGGPK